MQAGEEALWATMRSRLWPDCGPEDNAQDLRQLRDPTGALKIVLIAFVEELPVGFAEISERSVVAGAYDGPSGYLEGWYVAPEHRRRGFGSALIAAAADWARDSGYANLGSDVELENSGSQKAHEALGFEEQGRVITYLMALTP